MAMRINKKEFEINFLSLAIKPIYIFIDIPNP